jgi:ribose transport system ATP-binding protein
MQEEPPVSHGVNASLSMPSSSPRSPVALGVAEVSKTYPGTRALRSVSLSIQPGELHALVGGNGSGKSTLVKLLAGVEQADPGGTITVGAQVLDATRMTPAAARSLGLRFVHQDAGVFPDMSIAENLALGRAYETGLGGRVRWKRLTARARQELEVVGLDCDPAGLLGRLGAARQTLVAIARALADLREDTETVLILDEPTAALPGQEARALLETLRRLTAGGLAVLLITHRLEEVVGVADRVSVLRDGQMVACVDGRELTEERLVEQIVGRPLGAVFPEMPEPSTDQAALTVRNLTVGPLRDVSLTVRRGEVVGVAGLLGTGRTTLLRAIYGDLKPDAGQVQAGEQELTGPGRASHGPPDAIRAGIGYVPEDRKREAIFGDLSVRANLLLASVPEFWRRYGMASRQESSEARDLVTRFGIKAPGIANPISALSGGNQQKTVLARWLRRRPALLLLDEPTQGVDIGARADIYRIIRAAVEQGTAVLMVASDFDELARVCDRVLVLRRGRIVAEVRPPDLDHDHLTHLAYQG